MHWQCYAPSPLASFNQQTKHRINLALRKKNSQNINKANLRDLVAAASLVILFKFDSNRLFFSLCDLEIWWMTSKNNRTPLLYYIKLCASFQNHRKFKLELQSGNAQFRSKSSIFCLLWSWNLMDDIKQGKSEGFDSCHQPNNFASNWIQIMDFFGPCDLQIWWMTSKNTRAPLLYYIKLCASFQTHWWIQTAVTVQKSSIWVKIDDFLPCVTLKYDGWPWQIIGHLFYATSSFVNHFKAIGEFKLEWQSGNAQFHSKSVIFVPCEL